MKRMGRRVYTKRLTIVLPTIRGGWSLRGKLPRVHRTR